jgi:hypothetical protein
MITRTAVITMGIKIPGCDWFNWNNIAVDGNKTDPTYLRRPPLWGASLLQG